MVGETRDLETAQIAIQASLTGHLVFTTLHTNDAPGAITRLIDMGVEPFLISSTLEAVLGQRLLRSICPDCRTAYQPNESLLAELDLSLARNRRPAILTTAKAATVQPYRLQRTQRNLRIDENH